MKRWHLVITAVANVERTTPHHAGSEGTKEMLFITIVREFVIEEVTSVKGFNITVIAGARAVVKRFATKQTRS